MLVASLLSSLLAHLGSLPSLVIDAVVFALVFGEAALFVGFVLPGETAVLVAGALASQGHLNVVGLCCCVVVAAVVGDTVGYVVGQRYGHRLLNLPVIRHRRVAIDRALAGLERRGPTYVFIGRFTAFLRAVMPGLAGMSRMHYRRFLLANALGGLLWGVGYTLLGYFAGAALTKVEHTASWVALGVLVLVVVLVYWRHRRRARTEAVLDEQWEREHPDPEV